MPQSWFKIRNASGDSCPEIDILDEIGFWGVTARRFIRDAREALDGQERVIVNINSGGGSVFDGTAIYNFLKEHDAEVEVKVLGIAASIASVIAMAGDRVLIADNAMMMIHNASGFALGTKEEMSQMADLLEKLDANILKSYARTGIAEDELQAMMDKETWMDGEEAVEMGFADELTGEVRAVASVNIGQYDKVPSSAKTIAAGVGQSDNGGQTRSSQQLPPPPKNMDPADAPLSDEEKSELEKLKAADQARKDRADLEKLRAGQATPAETPAPAQPAAAPAAGAATDPGYAAYLADKEKAQRQAEYDEFAAAREAKLSAQRGGGAASAGTSGSDGGDGSAGGADKAPSWKDLHKAAIEDKRQPQNPTANIKLGSALSNAVAEAAGVTGEPGGEKLYNTLSDEKKLEVAEKLGVEIDG